MFKDPVLKKLYKKYGPHEFEDRSKRLMEELVEAIINQQLSGKAADTIYKRFRTLFNVSDGEFPSPEKILKMDIEKLRTAGMSYSKARYIRNIAGAFKNRDLDIKKIKKMNNEEVIAALTKIKGVGKWTAEMILIFSLKREDVFSLGDAGLKKAVKKLYKLEKDEDILKLTQTWKPYRSHACWYLWRSLENTPNIK